ncbi:uncharacterized protein LOC118943635 [Oncorhynchus mykiss]|uniref:ribonuclease H n=1 Tax=Oncorhynchus mykiss TaxID=8022 RepID=A0A8C7RIM7_ONCMY|nr:uncharacterized protein LOC118943635 [Oncorhynchus mykiss]
MEFVGREEDFDPVAQQLASSEDEGRANENEAADQRPVEPEVKRMASIGKIDVFDDTQENWATYIERLEQYFIANDIADNKRVPALLSLIGPKTYSLLRDLTAPLKPSNKTFTEIVEILQNHLSPKPLLIAERFRFHKRDQNEGEGVSTYVAVLKKLSEHCQLGENLNDTLRDRFVCGLKHEHIQKRLLTESELTFAKAVEIAVAMEIATKDAFELQSKRSTDLSQISLHKFSRSRQRPRVAEKCNRCDRDGHKAEDCRFKDEICHKCSRRGHIQRACKAKFSHISKTEKIKGLVNTLAENSGSDSDERLIGTMALNTVTSPSSSIIWVTPDIKGKPLKMELDTGSAVSIISTTVYNEHFKAIKLKNTNVLLKTYSGERLSPMGALQVRVHYGGQTQQLQLYVVPGTGPPLFGREWLSKIKLNWCDLKMLHTFQSKEKGTDQTLEHLRKKYNTVFSDQMGTVKGFTAKLVLRDDATPKFCKARSVPYSLRPKVEAEIDRLQDTGILTKVDRSEWATPIVPIVKKDGSVRMCGDFEVTVNSMLHVDQYPLPRLDDIFAALAGGKHFSKIDLKQAYLQLPVEESSKQYLTINTHKGLYRYNRLVFGIASAPAIWQRTIDQILQGIPGTQCILDDMIITGRTDKEHLANLEEVLKRLKEYGLQANLKKCEFFKDKIVFCGHEIDCNGLHKTQDKIEAVVQAPRPQNITEVRSFTGLINYYRRFLPNLSAVLQPLNQLLEKNRTWRWTEQCENAFLEAKRLITSEQVLMHYDPEMPVKLACDASPYGLGAVLSHTLKDGSERPVAFASRTLNDAEKNYSQIDKEALALVWGVKKFHAYLYGKRFTLVTDHQPLLSIFSPKKGIPAMTAARLQRYALFLASHMYDIEFKPSSLHTNADGLSRLPCTRERQRRVDAVDMFHTAQLKALPVTSTVIKQETRKDVKGLETLHMPAPVPVHPWEWPAEPWQRIHVDYAGPFEKHIYFSSSPPYKEGLKERF